MTSEPVERVDLTDVVVNATGVSKRFARFHRRATSLKERLVRREQGLKESLGPAGHRPRRPAGPDGRHHRA